MSTEIKQIHRGHRNLLDSESIDHIELVSVSYEGPLAPDLIAFNFGLLYVLHNTEGYYGVCTRDFSYLRWFPEIWDSEKAVLQYYEDMLPELFELINFRTS